MYFVGEPCDITSSGVATAFRGSTHRPSGIVRLKYLARSYLWWPGLNGDIEKKVKSCQVCQLQSAAPSTAPFILGCG